MRLPSERSARCVAEPDVPVSSSPPLTFVPRRSRLIDVLRKPRKDQEGLRLSREEFIRLVTWFDANAPFYGVYEGKKNIKWKDDPEFRPDPKLASAK